MTTMTTMTNITMNAVSSMTVCEDEYKKSPSTHKPSKKHAASKRVDIVSLKMVRERSFLYQAHTVSNKKDAYRLVQPLLESADREQMVAVCLDTSISPPIYRSCPSVP